MLEVCSVCFRVGRGSFRSHTFISKMINYFQVRMMHLVIISSISYTNLEQQISVGGLFRGGGGANSNTYGILKCVYSYIICLKMAWLFWMSPFYSISYLYSSLLGLIFPFSKMQSKANEVLESISQFPH